MNVVIAMAYLAVMAIADLIHREVSVRSLVVGSVAAMTTAGTMLARGGTSWEALAFGAVPGVVILAVAALTGGAGIGDGIVLLQMDLFLSWNKVIFSFGLSLIVMALFSLALLLLKKGKKEMRLPYLPFLWLGCVGACIACG